MILYFSATGNNKYVAEKIAEATEDYILPLKNLVRQKNYKLTIKDNENFGVVMPTYWEGLPSILIDYLENADIDLQGSRHYNYFVATYGCDYGNILSTAQKAFRKKGVQFDSLFAARFVDNWSPMFYLKDSAKNRRAEMNGEAETEEIAEQIVNRVVGHTLPDQMFAVAAMAAKANYNRIRKTKLFTVDKNKCVGCGLCARQCPLNAIELQNHHPVWIKETCTLCLGCFHRCPVAAIDYDKCSLKNGQYVNKNVKLDD